MGIYLNRAQMTVTGAPGTGTITLGAASTGYLSFASAGAVDGQTYGCLAEDGTSWELFKGVYTASGTTLTRGTLVKSSTGSALSLTSSATISVIFLADDILNIPYVAKTGNYTPGNADGVIDCTSGSFTITLPTAVSKIGKSFTIKNSGSGRITVATTSSQTIDGQITQYLLQYDAMTVVSNGSNWLVI